MTTANKSNFNYPIGLEPTHDERLIALLKTWNPIPTQEDSKYNDKLVWCLEHCEDKFRDICHFDTRVWYFQNEKDAAMFALKWG
jgi:hypothetical protein